LVGPASLSLTMSDRVVDAPKERNALTISSSVSPFLPSP
jgi:hypothetical protein